MNLLNLQKELNDLLFRLTRGRFLEHFSLLDQLPQLLLQGSQLSLALRWSRPGVDQFDLALALWYVLGTRHFPWLAGFALLSSLHLLDGILLEVEWKQNRHTIRVGLREHVNRFANSDGLGAALLEFFDLALVSQAPSL